VPVSCLANLRRAASCSHKVAAPLLDCPTAACAHSHVDHLRRVARIADTRPATPSRAPFGAPSSSSNFALLPHRAITPASSTTTGSLAADQGKRRHKKHDAWGSLLLASSF